MDKIKNAIEKRRSYYSISNKSPISDEAIKKLIEHSIKHTPSAFNSQSTRIVLLFNENHKKLWEIVKNELKKINPKESFEKTKNKIESSFEAGYGTILFYEDTSVIKELQNQFLPYKDNFPVWSEHTSAMHQYAIWVLLEEAGFGASLQHYNPLIDKEVASSFGINPDWKLIAQMPFGMPIEQPGNKTFHPIEDRFLIYK